MKKINFPYILFFSLLVAFSLITFFVANTISVTRHTSPTTMITPFPIALQLDSGAIQVVNAEQLQKLQLPDPQQQSKMTPHYLLNSDFFTNDIMPLQSILGTSITNGQTIHIPTNYTAQVSAKQLEPSRQEITITYVDGGVEDQVITTIYDAGPTSITAKSQFVKQLLIWKTIFMNGMTLSLILSFVVCKRRMKRAVPKPPTTP